MLNGVISRLTAAKDTLVGGVNLVSNKSHSSVSDPTITPSAENSRMNPGLGGGTHHLADANNSMSLYWGDQWSPSSQKVPSSGFKTLMIRKVHHNQLLVYSALQFNLDKRVLIRLTVVSQIEGTEDFLGLSTRRSERWS